MTRHSRSLYPYDESMDLKPNSQPRRNLDPTMIDVFASLPEWAKNRMSETPGYKYWKLCESCGISHRLANLRVCAACAECRREPIYYCSRECQKDDWNDHKADCADHVSWGKYKYSDCFDESVKKKISRWKSIHHQILYSSVLNVYHYNTHLDPRLTFVLFYLDPRSLQIQGVGVESRELQKQFLIELTKTTNYEHPFYYVVTVPPASSSVGFSDVFPIGDTTKLETPEARKTILPCPQWPWIAAYVTRNPQPSPIVANKMWTVLLSAIAGHLDLDTTFLRPEFTLPRFEISRPLTISKEQLSRFCARLQSIDLWSPMLRNAYPDTSVLYLTHVLDYLDSFQCYKKRRQK